MEMIIKMTEAAYVEKTFGLDSIGYCLSCGEETDGVEPDAREYECPACGAHEVYGLEECLLMGTVEFVD